MCSRRACPAPTDEPDPSCKANRSSQLCLAERTRWHSFDGLMVSWLLLKLLDSPKKQKVSVLNWHPAARFPVVPGAPETDRAEVDVDDMDRGSIAEQIRVGCRFPC